MINLIDTIFNPIIKWLDTIQTNLSNAVVPLSHGLPIQSLFNPIAKISPAWAGLISQVFLLSFIYIIIYIAMNSVGLIETFRNSIKWW